MVLSRSRKNKTIRGMYNKNKNILKYSNPKIVQAKANQYFHSDNIKIYLSNKPNKKYMVYSPNGQLIHFGQMGYEDFTKHKNIIRRQHYLSRATKIKGYWKKNKYSPNNLSIHLLW